eukprot:2930889-Prymnesium_polylepis.1
MDSKIRWRQRLREPVQTVVARFALEAGSTCRIFASCVICLGSSGQALAGPASAAGRRSAQAWR